MPESGRPLTEPPTQPPADPSGWRYPFSREEWEQLPPGVRTYIAALEQRLEQLEARLNRNSKNSNQPPSANSPFQKPAAGDKKSPGKPGGRKGHKGHRHAFLAPTHELHYRPERCTGCGGTHFADLRVYYTHQQVELPEIKPDVTHHCLHAALWGTPLTT